ncbi:MAG: hypothetical protein SPJ52_03890 [Candidatus Enterosoma sp.]|nr:hypothetical protein [bacterium]MDY3907517.1 hypothetical protein [Candidatus Enterosoma sp.]MDY5866261.1 hypothetical protein [Candidatus Enterosoma sp.]
MTYLERITFLYGEYIQLTGYLFKNTCMLMTMLSSDDKTMCDSISFFNKVEAESYRAYKYFSSLSTEKKEEMISSSLLSNRMKKELLNIIDDREKTEYFFFIENDFSSEEIQRYEQAISQLEEKEENCYRINQQVVKEIDKLRNRVI